MRAFIAKHRDVLGGVFCALAALVVFGASALHPFVYDDIYYVEQNPAIRQINPISPFFVPFSPYAPGLYRPVTTISYQIDYALFGLHPTGFHVTNILLHALAAFLVYLLLLRLFSSRTAAIFGGLLFAVHPVHSEAVLWVSGRSELLAACLALLSFLFFLSAREKHSSFLHAVSATIFFLAVSSKEIAAPLFFVFFLYDLVQKKEYWKKPLYHYKFYFASLGAYFLVRIIALGTISVPMEHIRTAGLSFIDRMFLMIPVIAWYEKLMIIPTGMRLEYDWSGFSAGITLLCFILIMLTLTGAVFLWKRGRRLESFGVLWFFLFLLPVSNIIPIGEFVAERFLYLPSVALCILLAVLLLQIPPKYTRTMVLSFVLLLFAVISFNRLQDWRDPETLWRETLQLSPSAPHALENLAGELLAEGNDAEAATYIEQGQAQYPTSPKFFLLAGELAERQGFSDQASQYYEQALSLADADDLSMTHFQRGSLFLRLGRYEDALAELQMAMQQDPENPALLNNAAAALGSLGKLREAMQLFEKSIYLYEAKPHLSAEDQRNYEAALENYQILQKML